MSDNVTTKKPKFSVLMANYNHGRFVAQAVESIVEQTFKDWELLLMDDASTDDSRQIIGRLSAREPRIKDFYNQKNIGYIDALKALTREARGEIIAIVDSDDALDERALEKVNQAYAEHPECGFIYTNFKICDDKLNPIKDGYSKRRATDFSEIIDLQVVALRTYTMEAYYKTSGYDDEIKFAEDRDLVLKMEEITKLFFIDQPLYYYRILHTSQASGPRNKRISRTSYVIAKYKAYQRRLGSDLPNLSKRQMADELLYGFSQSIWIGDFKRAVSCLKESIRLKPFNPVGVVKIFFRGVRYNLGLNKKITDL